MTTIIRAFLLLFFVRMIIKKFKLLIDNGYSINDIIKCIK